MCARDRPEVKGHWFTDHVYENVYEKFDFKYVPRVVTWAAREKGSFVLSEEDRLG